MEMKEILDKVLEHERLTREETRDIIVGITQGEYPGEQISALLTGLQMRGVTVDELLWIAIGILTWWERAETARTLSTSPPRLAS